MLRKKNPARKELFILFIEELNMEFIKKNFFSHEPKSEEESTVNYISIAEFNRLEAHHMFIICPFLCVCQVFKSKLQDKFLPYVFSDLGVTRVEIRCDPLSGWM